MNEVIITTPITIIPTTEYALVIRDYYGVHHYFNHDGTYDGYSKDCTQCNPN